MPPPLPILCSSCSYDITFLADAAHADPMIPCPECGSPVAHSLPEQRTQLAVSRTLRDRLRGYLLLHLRPSRIWRNVPLNDDDALRWTLNPLIAAIVVSVLIVVSHVMSGSSEDAVSIAIAAFITTWLFLLGLTLLIALIGWGIAMVFRWRLTQETFWTALERASLLWPATSALPFICLLLAHEFADSFTISLAILLAFFLLTLIAPPFLVLRVFLQGLHSLRYANPPRPAITTEQNSVPQTPADSASNQ